MPPLQSELDARRMEPEALREVAELLTQLEAGATRELTDRSWHVRPEAVARVRIKAPDLAEEFDGADGKPYWSLCNRMAEILRLQQFVSLVLEKGGAVEFG